jgi:ribosomal protein L32
MKRSGENRPQTQTCPGCGAPRIAHRICLACGQYGGKTVIAQKTETE